MFSKSCGIAAVAAVAYALSLAPAAQPLTEVQPAPGTRLVIENALPAIDRGLSLQDVSAAPEAIAAAADDDLPYVPGRVIVKLRAGAAGSTELAALAQSVGGSPTPTLPYANFDILKIGADENPEEVARVLAGRPDVEYAQAAYRAKLHYTPSDPMYRMQWNFPAIDMERAWDINPGASSSVIVAVLDSGIAFENITIRYNTVPITVIFPDGTRQVINYGLLDVPYAAATDLAGPNRFVTPYDFTWNDVHPVDTLGHGTHVAGTIGQLTSNGLGGAGMAFNVRLMPVKIAAGSNWDLVFRAPSPNFSDDQVARAIRYAADNGAKAMNMSFGRTGAPAPVVEDAVRYAVSKGAFCVFSAGNSALIGSPIERLAEIATRVEGAVAVGAVGQSLNRSRYSSIGSWVELSAPGGDTFQVGPTGGILQQTLDAAFFASPLRAPRFDVLNYQFLQGTSMAAPHVTGFAALLVQQGLTTPAAIEAAMKRYATDRGTPGRDDEYGVGIINPRATLRGLGLAK
jgi:serine protease